MKPLLASASVVAAAQCRSRDTLHSSTAAAASATAGCDGKSSGGVRCTRIRSWVSNVGEGEAPRHRHQSGRRRAWVAGGARRASVRGAAIGRLRAAEMPTRRPESSAAAGIRRRPSLRGAFGAAANRIGQYSFTDFVDRGSSIIGLGNREWGCSLASDICLVCESDIIEA